MGRLVRGRILRKQLATTRNGLDEVGVGAQSAAQRHHLEPQRGLNDRGVGPDAELPDLLYLLELPLLFRARAEPHREPLSPDRPGARVGADERWYRFGAIELAQADGLVTRRRSRVRATVRLAPHTSTSVAQTTSAPSICTLRRLQFTKMMR